MKEWDLINNGSDLDLTRGKSTVATIKIVHIDKLINGKENIRPYIIT